MSEFASTRQGASDSSKLQLMIKLYRNGKMSQFFDELKLGKFYIIGLDMCTCLYAETRSLAS